MYIGLDSTYERGTEAQSRTLEQYIPKQVFPESLDGILRSFPLVGWDYGGRRSAKNVVHILGKFRNAHQDLVVVLGQLEARSRRYIATPETVQQSLHPILPSR